MMHIELQVLWISARWPFAWDFGNEIDIVHKNLVVRVLQSRMTVGRQERSTLKVPRSSCTVVQVLVCNTVRKCMQTSKHIILSAWQFNGKRHKIPPNIIMTVANVCSPCTILDDIAWRRGCTWWRWRNNGHGERTMLVSFDDQYAMGYHCLRKTVAWPALQGSKWVI